MTAQVESAVTQRLIDHYHGWHLQPDDPPGALRGASDVQRRVLDILRQAPPNSRTIVFYGGAAGGGKSNLLANLPYKIALEVPGASLLVARQAMVHLKATTLLEFDESVDPRLQLRRFDSAPTYRDVRTSSENEWSRVWFRPMDDWQALMSTAYNGFCIEEGQETAERGFLALLTRLRHPATSKWFAVVGFNPFPSWCTEWALHGALPPEITEDPDTHVHFVPSRIADNPYLKPGYEAFLRATLSGDPWMTAVLIDGTAEHVPNAVYGALNDPAMRRLCQAERIPGPSEWRRAVTGWDWGTSEAHKSAGVLLGLDKLGLVWVLDAWESSRGSSDELINQAEEWRLHAPLDVRSARYDKSQASLEDDLARLYPDTQAGVRDVEGRIRVGRGVLYAERLRFNWKSPGARQLYHYLTLYHRDDDDRIVERDDDMVDAYHYGLWCLEHPPVSYLDAPKPRAVELKYEFAEEERKPLSFGPDEPVYRARQGVERVR